MRYQLCARHDATLKATLHWPTIIDRAPKDKKHHTHHNHKLALLFLATLSTVQNKLRCT